MENLSSGLGSRPRWPSQAQSAASAGAKIRIQLAWNDWVCAGVIDWPAHRCRSTFRSANWLSEEPPCS